MNGSAQEQVEFIVRTVAQTALDNEKYFGDLDAVVGDGERIHARGVFRRGGACRVGAGGA